MSKVTRYTCEIETIGGDYYVDSYEVSPIQNPQGDFVKYSDYELLEQAYADLEKKYAELEKNYEILDRSYSVLESMFEETELRGLPDRIFRESYTVSKNSPDPSTDRGEE